MSWSGDDFGTILLPEDTAAGLLKEFVAEDTEGFVITDDSEILLLIFRSDANDVEKDDGRGSGSISLGIPDKLERFALGMDGLLLLLAALFLDKSGLASSMVVWARHEYDPLV